MSKIEEALRHVQQHHPEVTQVFYGWHTKWLYCDDEFKPANFGPEIDIGLLEDAQNEVTDFPFAFTLPEEEEKTYRIVRKYQSRFEDEEIDTGLTLEGAKEGCKDADSSGVREGIRWMDVYYEE